MLTIFTIVKNGLPFLPIQLSVFNQLTIPWRWIVAEGTADNIGSTSWCAKPEPGLSTDGSVEFLDFAFKNHSRITVMHNPLWPGKDAMCNACLDKIKEPCVLLEVDVDEVYTPQQIEKIVHLFDRNPLFTSAKFWCRYWVGSGLLTVSKDHYGNRRGFEWHRAWRFEPGMKFKKHEPPVLDGNFTESRCFSRDFTKSFGVVFDHFSWALEKQVESKRVYYKYQDATACWKKLQLNTRWPCKLSEFFHWVEPDVVVDSIPDIFSVGPSLVTGKRLEEVAFFFGDGCLKWPAVFQAVDDCRLTHPDSISPLL